MDELIKRSDVLALAESGVLVSNGNYKSVVDAINGIPAVDRWIPCSERMPKPGIEVLVTYELKKTRYVGVAEMFSDYSFHGYDDEYLTPDGCNRKAVAWMPLPEPYKPNEDTVNELCRSDYAAQLESLGYNPDGNPKNGGGKQ